MRRQRGCVTARALVRGAALLLLVFISGVVALSIDEPGACAAPATRLRALVRVVSSADLVAATRLRSQAADLAVEFTDVPSSALEPTLTDRLAAADVLRRQLRGDVVIWFEPERAGLYVAQPSPGYVLMVDRAPDPGTSPSAAVEQTALKLRRALKTLLEGGVVGAKREEPVAAVAPPVEGPLRALLQAGVQQLFDGASSTTGLVAAGGLAVRRFELSLALAVFRDREGRTAFDNVALERHDLRANFGLVVLRSDRAHLLALAALGLASIDYVARDRDDDDGEASVRGRTRPFVGGELRVRFPFWRPTTTTRVAFWAAGAVDAVWQAPSFASSGGGGGRFSLSTLQPRVGIGCELSGG